MQRVILIVLDSLGVGALPDASFYKDEGSNTLAHTARSVGGLNLPNFEKLGLGNITYIKGVPPSPHPLASYGKMAERSRGKDTTTGHWELMGIYTSNPFPVYPEGFPAEVIEVFEQKIGRKVLGNKPASGTEIIKELGEEHLKTGYPIVYTSADSVFQIAAHEDVISVEELYKMCQVARQILTGRHGVARVIARPFVGKPGNFTRTPRRKDFSLPPPSKTVLDFAIENGLEVHAVGKVSEIFAGRGITRSYITRNNQEGMMETLKLIEHLQRGLIFTTLIDFDMLWGHRNNPQGYAQGLVEVDDWIPKLLGYLRQQDVLIFTADHGCDPTTPSTDHSREYVPLLVYGRGLKAGIDLGVRSTLADVGKTIADFLGFEAPTEGRSFASLLY